jgi:hypothetical protein
VVKYLRVFRHVGFFLLSVVWHGRSRKENPDGQLQFGDAAGHQRSFSKYIAHDN